MSLIQERNPIDPALAFKVNEALDSIRPFLAADGGDIELVQVNDDMVAEVRLLGSCSTCHMSNMTLKAGVEEAIKRAVPNIIGVKAVG